MHKHPTLILAKAGRVCDGYHTLLSALPELDVVPRTDELHRVLDAVATHPASLVLIDFALVSDRIQHVIARIKHAAPSAKCLVLVDCFLQRKIARMSGADEVLMKGFQTKRLEEAIRRLLHTTHHQGSQGGNMILETHQLSKVYDAGQEQVHALQDVDFQAASGDFIVVNGPSGSGKTTFLNMVSLIDQPSSGEVFIEGKAMSNLSASELAEVRRDKIGLMFQAFNLIPVLSAYENVEYPLLLKGMPRRQRRDKVMGLLAGVDLEAQAHRLPDQLSGGQKQRVALARTLVNDPKIVLADEPTGNLDSHMGETVMALMKRLNDQHQVTFMVVTHDPLVNHYANRVVHIRDGQLSERTAPNAADALRQRAPQNSHAESATPEEVGHVVAPSAT